MNKEIENLELRSEEVQEVLGRIPSRFIRYGINFTVLILTLLLVGSFFFKYPDIIEAPFEIVTENPPSDLFSKSNGLIDTLFVSDSQHLRKGDLLAIIKNSANKDHMLLLEKQLKKSELNLFVYDSSMFNKHWQLGELQPYYAKFYKCISNYHEFRQSNGCLVKNKIIVKKTEALKIYNKQLKQQVSLKRAAYNLEKNAFDRDSLLFVKEIISRADFEDSKKALIQLAVNVKDVENRIVENKLRQLEFSQQLSNNQLIGNEQKQKYETQIEEYYTILKGRIAWWHDTYAISAPSDGFVAFNTIWSTNQYVKANDHLFTLIPAQKQSIIARVSLPVKGAGKIRPGQTVNLRFDDYPYQEFGSIKVKVKSISLVPVSKQYQVLLKLPNKLITNYHTTLPFSQKMTGNALIITEDLPLITRIISPLKAFFMDSL